MSENSINLNNILGKYKQIYGNKEDAKKIEDFSLFNDEFELAWSDNPSSKLSKADDDGIITQEEFLSFFSEDCQEQAEEMYMLISCLDESEGLTVSEWDYIFGLDGDKSTIGIKNDLKKVVQEGKKELYYQNHEKETHYYDQGGKRNKQYHRRTKHPRKRRNRRTKRNYN